MGFVPLHPTFTPSDGEMPRIFCPITPNTYKQAMLCSRSSIPPPFTSYKARLRRSKAGKRLALCLISLSTSLIRFSQQTSCQTFLADRTHLLVTLEKLMPSAPILGPSGRSLKVVNLKAKQDILSYLFIFLITT